MHISTRIGDNVIPHIPYSVYTVLNGISSVRMSGKSASTTGHITTLHDRNGNDRHFDTIVVGSPSVRIKGRPAARTSSATDRGGICLGGGRVSVR